MDLKQARVAVLVEQQYQEMEVWYPIYRLREAGCKVTLVGPEAGATYPSKLGYPAKSDKAARDCTPDDFDAMVIPGGFAPDFLRRHEAVLKLVRHIAEQGKPIAAICHGPQILAAAGVLKGKSCSAYPAVAPEVTAAGGTFAEVAIDAAHTSGNLVSGPAWPAHPAWLAQFLKVLGTKIEL